MIPFSKPSITQEEIDAVIDVLKSGWLTVGDKVKEFEQALSDYTGLYSVAVDSCTSALTLSLSHIYNDALSGGALVPALTFIATANAAHKAGWNVAFCDVGWDGNINPSIIENNYGVIIPVHFAGQVCDLSMIYPHAQYLIEDAAHAVGAKYLGESVGGIHSDGACFSFYPTKNMTTIEGGAFVAKRNDIVNNIRKLSLHGLDSSHISRYERSSVSKPIAETIGFKANMTNVDAAIGIVQLKRLNSFIEKRREISEVYRNELKDNIRFLELNGRDHVWHMVVGLVDNRDEIVTKARELGVGLGIHYSPIIPAHPIYTELTGYKRGQFPIAEYIADHCISLPLYNDITEQEVEKVIDVMKGLL